MDHVIGSTNWWNMKQNREYYSLSRLIPEAHVVKALNTISAWALQNGPSDANRQVMFVSLNKI